MGLSQQIGDVIDVALPCVTGLGEAVDATKTTVRIMKGADEVVDTAKAFRRAADATSDVKKATGAYVVVYEAGEYYVGKGGFKRSIDSAVDHMTDTNGVKAIIWAPTSSEEGAFVAENLLQSVFGVGTEYPNNFNKIWSPGKNLFKILQ